MPAPSSSPIHPVLAELAAAADANRVAGPSLLAALAGVPDPRARRGVRHQVSAVLALAVCAVLAGARSFTTIGEWAANASDPGVVRPGDGRRSAVRVDDPAHV